MDGMSEMELIATVQGLVEERDKLQLDLEKLKKKYTAALVNNQNIWMAAFDIEGGAEALRYRKGLYEPNPPR